jgi:hypothetical protein
MTHLTPGNFCILHVIARTRDRLTLAECPWPFWFLGLLLISLLAASIFCALREFPAFISAGPGSLRTLAIVIVCLISTAMAVALLIMPQTRWDFDLQRGTATRTWRWCCFLSRKKVWPLEALSKAELVNRERGDENGPAYGIDLITRDGHRIRVGAVASREAAAVQSVFDALSALLTRT